MNRPSYRQIPEWLLSLGSERGYRQGDTVFRTGDAAHAVYFLLEGEVHLLRYGPDGTTVILHRAVAGGFFAEASLGTDRYHCTALCVRPARVLVLPASGLRRRLGQDPDFAVHWVSILSTQLRRQRATVERLRLRSARERIRHYLLTEGVPPGTLHLECPLTHWADMLGLTRESLYRTLANMEGQGELQRSGDTLMLIGT